MSRHRGHECFRAASLRGRCLRSASAPPRRLPAPTASCHLPQALFALMERGPFLPPLAEFDASDGEARLKRRRREGGRSALLDRETFRCSETVTRGGALNRIADRAEKQRGANGRVCTVVTGSTQIWVGHSTLAKTILRTVNPPSAVEYEGRRTCVFAPRPKGGDAVGQIVRHSSHCRHMGFYGRPVRRHHGRRPAAFEPAVHSAGDARSLLRHVS